MKEKSLDDLKELTEEQRRDLGQYGISTIEELYALLCVDECRAGIQKLLKATSEELDRIKQEIHDSLSADKRRSLSRVTDNTKRLGALFEKETSGEL